MNIMQMTPLILLGIFLCSTMGKGLGIDFVDKRTCLELQQEKVRVNQLWNYTKQTIPKEAILFVTKKGKELCADPSMPWVKKAVAVLDERAKYQINSKKATSSKNTAGKNRKGKKKNNKNIKKNVKNVLKVKPSQATPTSMRSVMQS